MDILLIILLVLLLCGGVGTYPAWPHAASFGYAPSGLMMVLFIVLLIYLIRGR
jgi:hypothetical protein